MKGAVIALDTYRGREAAALIEDGRLSDLLIASARPRPGTIWRARVGRPVKGQGGVFLDTPEGPAFLRQTRGQTGGLAPGRPLLVQLTGHAEPGKALPVTAKLMFKSRHAIVTPGAPGINLSRRIRDADTRGRLLEIAHAALGGGATGLILRSAAEAADEDEIAADIRAMAALAARVLADADGAPEKLHEGCGPHALAWRDWAGPASLARGPGAFAAHGVAEAIDALARPESPLPGGGSLIVEPTRALVAVDVNTGADTSPAAGIKANLAAARELPRQLRLRGLGGQITLDLAPLPKRDRRAFEAALGAALRRDAVETVLAGWTPLGHFELQRKRERVPLWEVLAEARP